MCGDIMRVINWNISYAGDTEKKMEYLDSILTTDSLFMLEEVKPHAFEIIKAAFSDRYHLVYSLDFRKPSKFDSDARRLGVVIGISKTYTVEEVGVIERNLFPDRTLYATIIVGGKRVKMLALHSITGCGYYRSKSVQYDTFAEFIDEYKPDIIGIDANEPQQDHYEINKMKFFDNGPGAGHFFEEIQHLGLCDTFVQHNQITTCVEGEPLAKTHYIRRKGAVRYDFLFANRQFDISSMNYYYEGALSAGSDHALAMCDIVF